MVIVWEEISKKQIKEINKLKTKIELNQKEITSETKEKWNKYMKEYDKYLKQYLENELHINLPKPKNKQQVNLYEKIAELNNIEPEQIFIEQILAVQSLLNQFGIELKINEQVLKLSPTNLKVIPTQE